MRRDKETMSKTQLTQASNERGDHGARWIRNSRK